MRKQDPAGEIDEASAPVAFGDPFGPYPEEPYPGSVLSAEAPAPENGTTTPRTSRSDDLDPPTDPGVPAVAVEEAFDPFAPDAFWFPERPWYRKKQATLAMGAIGAAGVAILVAAVLLVSLDSGGSGRSKNTPSGTVTSAPTTTGLTSSQPSEPPPPPPPPPPETPPSAQTQSTWVPQYPQYPQNGGDRPNVTTPQTRPPQISVRPTHRPAFPGQPGGG